MLPVFSFRAWLRKLHGNAVFAMVGPRGFEPLTFCTPIAPEGIAGGGGKRRTPAFIGVRDVSKIVVCSIWSHLP